VIGDLKGLTHQNFSNFYFSTNLPLRYPHE
jgi:hypothetical protein